MVEVALQLAGQPALTPAKVPGLWPDPKRRTCPVFHLPALTGSWEQCAEGLTHPFTGATRPFVFDHNLAKGREDVLLVHLNHRLVQMSLRLLRAEVWSREGRKRLHRITARVVPDGSHLADPGGVRGGLAGSFGAARAVPHAARPTPGSAAGAGAPPADQPEPTPRWHPHYCGPENRPR